MAILDNSALISCTRFISHTLCYSSPGMMSTDYLRMAIVYDNIWKFLPQRLGMVTFELVLNGQ